jgi:hypothetical protein
MRPGLLQRVSAELQLVEEGHTGVREGVNG